MADIREEDFTRMQAQIIELRTANYDSEVKCQRQGTELEKLREKTTQLERELEKSNKIIQKSKNKKEYSLLLDETEGLQQQLRDHEEDFKLQNKTLREEVTRIEGENKKLFEELKNLKSGKNGEGSGSFNETELRRLKAENSALQKSLKTTQELYEAELLKRSESEKLEVSQAEDNNQNDNQTNNGNIGSLSQDKDHILSTEQDNQETIENTIENEFTKTISSAFETFYNNMGKDSSENNDGQLGSTENIVHTTGSQDVHEAGEDDQDDDEDKDKHFNCSDEEFGNLQENILKEIHILVQEKKICSRQPSLKAECSEKADEGVVSQKHFAQLTEMQLNLTTEREEKKLLEEQLQTLETHSRSEISKLKEENEKLTEKAKRKQESFTQLQEEKENIYNENKKAMEELKRSHENIIKVLADQTTQLTQQLETIKKELEEHQQTSENKIKELNNKLVDQENQATLNVDETIQELDNARIENSSLNEQLQSLQEACESFHIENEDQKVLLIAVEDKVKEMEDSEIELKADKEQLKSELQEASLSYEHLRRQVDEMMNEQEHYLQSTNEATKLAEKRKQMLDEYSINQQKAITEHKEQMEKMETEYKETAVKKQEEYKKTIEDLKTQLQGEKKLKKELEEKQQKFTDVSAQLSSIESKCGWFERRLAETEETLNDERQKSKQTSEETRSQHELNINEITIKHSEEIQELDKRILEIEGERKEQTSLIEKYQQEMKDKDVENVIAGKKGDHLVKELKKQLKSERKKSELLQQRLQEAASENRARENFDRIFDPNISNRRNSGDSSMLSGSSLTFDNQEYKDTSPDTSMDVSVNDETLDLISRIADIQQEKWQLEERVRHLEENCSAMAEDLMQKAAVIQHYAMETKLEGGKEVMKEPESNFKTRMKGTFHIGKQEEFLKEVNKKLQIMLEETLMKNIQLQNAVESLTQDNSSANQGSSQTDGSSNR